MKLTFRSDKFCIYDEVCPPSLFEQLWLHVQNENYSLAIAAGSWLKVWRLGDNFPLGSTEYYWNKKPFNNYMDAVGHYFNEIVKVSTDLIGEWQEMVMRTYIYPRNTKLSWHNDANHYAGALTYYVHPKWGSTWGGELLCSSVPDQIRNPPQVGPHLDHEWEDEYILEHGVGQFIFPKPNRCVVMAPGVYHSVNRVDADAGDHCRVSVVGFLTKGN